MSHDESICRRCGECCRIKVELPGGRVVLTGEYCKHLDVATKRCRVYAMRHLLLARDKCLSVPDAVRLRMLPGDCPYVSGVEGYRAAWDEKRD